MPWINVLGIDADKQSTAAAAYGITSIPANFLISPDGIIVAKNLRGGSFRRNSPKCWNSRGNNPLIIRPVYVSDTKRAIFLLKYLRNNLRV